MIVVEPLDLRFQLQTSTRWVNSTHGRRAVCVDSLDTKRKYEEPESPAAVREVIGRFIGVDSSESELSQAREG